MPLKTLQFLSAAVGAFVFIVPASVLAQETEFEVGAATEYMGKGLSKSDGRPSVNGTVEVGARGFYGSVFASTARLTQGSDAEVIAAVGYRPSVAGFDLDLQVMNRDLPGTRAGIDRNYWEYQADIEREFGRASARLRVNYSPDGFAATREAWWVELQGGFAIDGKTRFTAAAADRTADGGAEYAAWNAGVKRKLTSSAALDVRWYDTDSEQLGDAYDGRVVAALTYAF